MIEQKYIDMILDRVSIEEVVGKYCDLKRKGRRLWACCPFHNEKTPSFCVEPDKGTWHCFGACQTGGNVIGFYMKAENLPFPKAVKQLLKEYLHITLQEADIQKKPEDEENERLRETMFIYNTKISEFFVSQLQLDTPSAKAAKAYVRQRWGEEFPQEMGIGYAPDDWTTFDRWADQNTFDFSILEQMGVVKMSEKTHTYYCTYKNRITIPIRDRYSRITGFTARTMDDHDDTAKYKNSSTSLIYNKDSSVFGIDIAARQAIIERKVYLVEGGPDVMKLQSIGILNVVASLGGAWTKNQLEALRRLHANLCFIPDSDPPKRGETLGAGFKNVIKNGTLAMQLGFSVSVREIPNDTGRKQDPDSYITSMEIFERMTDEEFIMWYARVTWKDDMLVEERQQFIANITDVIVCIHDEELQQEYLSQLVEKYRNRTAWNNGMKAAKRRRQERISKRDSKGDIDMLREFGFTERHHCYYGTDKDGKEVKWSNFTMKPLFHIKDDIRPVRLFEIKNDDEACKAELIELDMDTLTSAKNLRRKLLGIGNYTWLADDNALIMLQTYLARVTETAVEIKQLGWNRLGFYCFCNGAWEDGQWIPVDKMGIIRLKAGKFYMPAMSKLYEYSTELFANERRFIHQTMGNISMNDYFLKMIDVFGDNAKVAICFYIATLFRDIIKHKLEFFPILNIFGPKGTGKTQLAKTLSQFFFADPNPPSLETSTMAALSDLVASVSNAIVHLDEYKNSIPAGRIEWLKDLLGGIGRVKMDMDKDKKRIQARVDSGIIITGQEMPTSDIALFSRLIFLTFDKTYHNSKEREKFNDLMHYRTLGTTHITLQLLASRDSFEISFNNALTKAGLDLERGLRQYQVMDRIEYNWKVILAAYLAIEPTVKLPFSYDNLLKVCIEGARRQNDLCENTDEVAKFWNIIDSAHQKGMFQEDQDYMIRSKQTFASSKFKNGVDFGTAKPILMVRKNSMIATYKQLGRQMDEHLLPSESLIHYLENTPEYLGTTIGAQRFKHFLANGLPLQEPIKDAKGNVVGYHTKNDKDRPMCFDYNKISEKYGIIMDSASDDIDYKIPEAKQKAPDLFSEAEDDTPF